MTVCNNAVASDLRAAREFLSGIGVPPAKDSLKREFGYSSSTAWRIAFRMNRN